MKWFQITDSPNNAILTLSKKTQQKNYFLYLMLPQKNFFWKVLNITYLREPIVSKALERKLREWTIVNTLEALDSKFMLTKALTKL